MYHSGMAASGSHGYEFIRRKGTHTQLQLDLCHCDASEYPASTLLESFAYTLKIRQELDLESGAFEHLQEFVEVSPSCTLYYRSH